MKRHNNLWPGVTDFTNLLEAADKAKRGKRFQPNVLRFHDRLAEELLQLQDELTTKTYQPGPYYTFQIVEPKKRMISAAPYRDRVVHHALCNVIAPIFERTFISTSYANRVGFGTHRALKRFTEYARGSRYILQCDIRKYFPSIDHEILKTIVRRKIKCGDTLWLIDRIRVRADNLRRARKRLRGLQDEFRLGRIEWEEIKQSLRSWCAHLEHGDTWQLREQVFSNLVFSRG
ncbi:MAG: hypothetical protein ACREEM_09875 [Blastocatellia bacterium]